MKRYKGFVLRAVLFVFIGALFVFGLLSLYSMEVMADLKDNLVRLHVVADSDDAEAQALKLKVRDSVAAYTGSLLAEADSVEESLTILRENIENIESVAKETIAAEGHSEPVKVTVGEFDFPLKSYGNITLPTGNYNALRVVIGSGSGRNWWCVLFPPLCFVDTAAEEVSASGMDRLEETLTGESFDVINGSGENLVLRFKIVDFFENVAQKVKTAWTNIF